VENRWYPARECGVPIDGNGNLVKKVGPEGETVYTWDARDRLVEIKQNGASVGQYKYNPSNLLMQVGDSRILLDGAEEVREYGVSQTRLDRDPQAPDVIFAQRGLDKDYIVRDAHRSVYRLVGQDATTASSYSYDVFGLRSSVSEQHPTPWGFVGRRWEGTVGLSYHRARFLDANAGRWISPDPLGDVDGPNRYQYVGNDPVIGSDPSGLAGCTPKNLNDVDNAVAQVRAEVSWFRDLGEKYFQYRGLKRAVTIDDHVEYSRFYFKQNTLGGFTALLPFKTACRCDQGCGMGGGSPAGLEDPTRSDVIYFCQRAFAEAPWAGSPKELQGLLVHEMIHVALLRSVKGQLVEKAGVPANELVWFVTRDRKGRPVEAKTAPQNLHEVAGEIARSAYVGRAVFTEKESNIYGVDLGNALQE